MHGSRWRREETRPVGPVRAAQPGRLSPTLLTAFVFAQVCVPEVAYVAPSVGQRGLRYRRRPAASFLVKLKPWVPARIGPRSLDGNCARWGWRDRCNCGRCTSAAAGYFD